MMINEMRKCFKVSSLKEKESIQTIKDDIIYVRNHPFIYLNIGNGVLKEYTKVYTNESHPKYNMDKLKTLKDPYMFKIENTDDLNSVPAKYGDFIYRNGDSFMYEKYDRDGVTTYSKILKS